MLGGQPAVFATQIGTCKSVTPPGFWFLEVGTVFIVALNPWLVSSTVPTTQWRPRN